MSVAGKWNVVIDSPLGKQEGVFNLVTDGDKLTGTSTGGGVTVDIREGSVDGARLKFMIRIKQPVPMKLHFDLTVSGNSLAGEVKAGMFGRQRVSGERA